ncbi:MAG: 4-hydroxy-3-methylbut-2-enyl diphosphate reductase [Trueperaceae bacterium]|nr:4-hydroxy-3-methylbut-2-enyl diphosphate reductase [Trueperaceae bacterium]
MDSMEIVLAAPRGFCAGVNMAVSSLDIAIKNCPGPVYVYHEIVHNQYVVKQFSAKGAIFVDDLSEIPAGSTVLFSAHGVSPEIRQLAKQRQLFAIDATCPLVTKVHNEAKRYAADGYHILLVGDSTAHQEVIGTRGEAPDQTTVVSVVGNRKHDPLLADPRTVTVPDPDKVVVLTQTTLSVDDTMKTVELLEQRFPNLVVPPSDDLCFATKNRQDAVRAIAPHVELFLVVTSAASSNGMRLVELAGDLTARAERIESEADVQDAWLAGVSSVGITSAASTPDDLVQAVVERFRLANPALAVVEEGEWENITFRKPKRVPAAP